jgi:toxin ParE1/3/4
VRVEWSVRAQLDVLDIADYIEVDNPAAAIAVYREIHQQVAALAAHPRMGRRGRVRGTRELVINRTPYVAAYRIMGDVARIVAVRHSARRWPGAL